MNHSVKDVKEGLSLCVYPPHTAKCLKCPYFNISSCQQQLLMNAFELIDRGVQSIEDIKFKEGNVLIHKTTGKRAFVNKILDANFALICEENIDVEGNSTRISKILPIELSDYSLKPCPYGENGVCNNTRYFSDTINAFCNSCMFNKDIK